MNLCARQVPTTTTRLCAVATASLAAFSAILLAPATATASVTIDAPSSLVAGPVELTGSVGSEPGQTTTVLYAFDATRSTGQVAGLDCSGNGVGGGPEDDLNGDGSVGDILDCEIAGVQALNRSLATTAGVQVGLVAFANQAAAANLDPTGPVTFVPPGYTGGDQRARLDTVASSVQRERIGLYDVKDLGGSGSGTAFNSAVSTALATLATAPAGPKWIMFLSDGLSGIDDSLLASLGDSGIRLRSFAIGAAATCDPSGSLYKMAATTGENCVVVGEPSGLAVELAGSQPDAVNGVTVTIGDVAVAATVNAVGGWRAGFTLGAGTYTATVRAVLASGAVQSARRTFTVVPPAPGAAAPTAGTISPGPEALEATAVQVDRPPPSRNALPSRVTGRVGLPLDKLTPVKKLAGSRVTLEARSADGAPWTAVDHDTVSDDGRYALRWRPKASMHLLRVTLEPFAGFAGSTAAVPEAQISACKVSKRAKRWTVTCQTTAKAGSVVRLIDGRVVEDRSRVRKGTFRLTGRGKVRGHRIELTIGRRNVRLSL